MKGIGIMMLNMVMVLSMPKQEFTKVNFKKTFLMDMAKWNGITVIFMKDNLNKDKDKEMVKWVFQMVICLKGSLKII